MINELQCSAWVFGICPVIIHVKSYAILIQVLFVAFLNCPNTCQNSTFIQSWLLPSKSPFHSLKYWWCCTLTASLPNTFHTQLSHIYIKLWIVKLQHRKVLRSHYYVIHLRLLNNIHSLFIYPWIPSKQTISKIIRQ